MDTTSSAGGESSLLGACAVQLQGPTINSRAVKNVSSTRSLLHLSANIRTL